MVLFKIIFTLLLALPVAILAWKIYKKWLEYFKQTIRERRKARAEAEARQNRYRQ